MNRKKKRGLASYLLGPLGYVRKKSGMNAVTEQSQDWRTPPWLFQEVERLAGGPVDLDPCTDEQNPLGVPFYYTEKENGLKQSWSIKDGAVRVYVNPPYKHALRWTEKAVETVQGNDRIVIYFLLPAFTDQPWYEVALAWCEEEWSVKGRVKFLRPDGRRATSPRFPSTLFGFGRTFGGGRIPLPGDCVKKDGRPVLRGVLRPPLDTRRRSR